MVHKIATEVTYTQEEYERMMTIARGGNEPYAKGYVDDLEMEEHLSKYFLANFEKECGVKLPEDFVQDEKIRFFIMTKIVRPAFNAGRTFEIDVKKKAEEMKESDKRIKSSKD